MPFCTSSFPFVTGFVPAFDFAACSDEDFLAGAALLFDVVRECVDLSFELLFVDEDSLLDRRLRLSTGISNHESAVEESYFRQSPGSL